MTSKFSALLVSAFVLFLGGMLPAQADLEPRGIVSADHLGNYFPVAGFSCSPPGSGAVNEFGFVIESANSCCTGNDVLISDSESSNLVLDQVNQVRFRCADRSVLSLNNGTNPEKPLFVKKFPEVPAIFLPGYLASVGRSDGTESIVYKHAGIAYSNSPIELGALRVFPPDPSDHIEVGVIGVDVNEIPAFTQYDQNRDSSGTYRYSFRDKNKFFFENRGQVFPEPSSVYGRPYLSDGNQGNRDTWYGADRHADVDEDSAGLSGYIYHLYESQNFRSPIAYPAQGTCPEGYIALDSLNYGGDFHGGQDSWLRFPLLNFPAQLRVYSDYEYPNYHLPHNVCMLELKPISSSCSPEMIVDTHVSVLPDDFYKKLMDFVLEDFSAFYAPTLRKYIYNQDVCEVGVARPFENEGRFTTSANANFWQLPYFRRDGVIADRGIVGTPPFSDFSNSFKNSGVTVPIIRKGVDTFNGPVTVEDEPFPTEGLPLDFPIPFTCGSVSGEYAKISYRYKEIDSGSPNERHELKSITVLNGRGQTQGLGHDGLPPYHRVATFHYPEFEKNVYTADGGNTGNSRTFSFDPIHHVGSFLIYEGLDIDLEDVRPDMPGTMFCGFDGVDQRLDTTIKKYSLHVYGRSTDSYRAYRYSPDKVKFNTYGGLPASEGYRFYNCSDPASRD